jgi:hypothetical protein
MADPATVEVQIQQALVEPKWSWGPMQLAGHDVAGAMVLTLHHPQAGPIVTMISHETARQIAEGLYQCAGGSVPKHERN